MSQEPMNNFTPRAQQVLALARKEADRFHHNYVGTEHILLGLIREGEGVAAQVLVKLGADLGRVRQQVIQLLSGYQGPAGKAETQPSGGAASEKGEGASEKGGSQILDQFDESGSPRHVPSRSKTHSQAREQARRQG